MHKIKQFILRNFLIYDFYNRSIIKRLTPPFFTAVTNSTTGLPIHFEPQPDGPNPQNGLHYVTYISPFANAVENKNLRYKSLYQFVGFMAHLKPYTSLETYMGIQFGAKSRSKIRAYGKRLDTCFQTSYTLYHGSIEKSDYTLIMNALEYMIKRRFDQRGDEHQAEKDWAHYKNTTYQYILENKASLFVIYDNRKPIDICLNYHFDKIMINYIRAFDIDYAKFRLGYIDIFKQLEWCFENNYEIFDLGAGVFSYKKQWCNVTYHFRNDIVFNKSSFLNTCLGYFIFGLLKLKLVLSNKNILKDKANASRDVSNTNTTNTISESEQLIFKQTEVKTMTITEAFTKIDIEQDAYAFLRQPIYEYLYLNFENKNNLTIYKVNEKQNSYYIHGKKNMLLAY